MTAAGWIELSPNALKGEGLGPYPEGALNGMFDWAEDHGGSSNHIIPHEGQFIVDVVAISPNAVHQPSKPGEEIVVVINGALILTTDGSDEKLVIEAGEAVLIPAGWAGLYRVTAEQGLFIELAIVPANYFEPGVAPPPSGLSPQRLALPDANGSHEVYRNRYSIKVHNIDQVTQWDVATPADEIVRVLAGTLTLKANGYAVDFGPESVVILPQGFAGKATASSGYRAFTARWTG